MAATAFCLVAFPRSMREGGLPPCEALGRAISAPGRLGDMCAGGRAIRREPSVEGQMDVDGIGEPAFAETWSPS